MSRYQFVWWGWNRRHWFWHPHRTAPPLYGGFATIYEWRIHLGPLEIRKWKTSP